MEGNRIFFSGNTYWLSWKLGWPDHTFLVSKFITFPKFSYGSYGSVVGMGNVDVY